MATINQVTLTISGNTGSIEFHTRQDGGIWATFDVAQTSRTQNPQTGQWEDGATTWIRCTASGYLAEHLQHSMLPTGPDGKQKGVPVIVTGSYVQREYTNQQGAKRSILELRATDLAAADDARQRPVERHGSPNQAARLHRRVRARGTPAAGDLTTTTHDQGRPAHTPGRPSPGEEANMRRHAMDEWIDTGDEEGAAKAFDAMDERIRPPIGAQPRQIIPSRTTLDACQRAGCPIEAGAIHAWLCTWSVRSIDGTVIRRDMLLIDVKRENEIWKATSRYRLDGIRTGRQAQAALLLAATGALRPIQERFK